jgi:hypothetical protein
MEESEKLFFDQSLWFQWHVYLNKTKTGSLEKVANDYLDDNGLDVGMEMLDAGTSSVCVLAAWLFDRRQKQALKGPQSHVNGPKVVPCRFTFNSILFFISHFMFKLAGEVLVA